MRTLTSRLVRQARAGAPGLQSPELVVGAGVLMLAVQLIFRGWALYGSWFYLDDYNLLIEAQDRRLSVAYLVEPYNSHLMPGGRLFAWLVAHDGPLNWGLAATLTLALQALAGAAALWALVTLFGPRWRTLIPLSLFLFTAMTLPAMMWWTASLNQVALGAAFFFAVGAWVRHLRTRRLRWLALTLASLGLGLFFYVKALLIVPVLALLALFYFSSGTPRRRVRFVVRNYWPAVITVGVGTVAYVVYYSGHVDEPFTAASLSLVGRIADSMIGTTFATAVVGGPWRWFSTAPPNAFANPPLWSQHAAWVVIVLTVLYGALRRRRTLRAWTLLGLYLVGLLVLLVNSRAPTYGPIIGREYRYLTDAACAVALCWGLAFLPLRGAVDSSEPRSAPLLTRPLPGPLVAGFVALVCLLSFVSATRYVHIWHTSNASNAYLHTLAAELRSQGSVDLADEAVPEAVISPIFAPDNLVHRLVPLMTDRASFPEATSRLAVVADNGTLHAALISASVRSRKGPDGECGWFVGNDGADIPLTGRAFKWTWWIRVGYLASRDSDIVVSAGDTTVRTTVYAGLHSLYVHVEGSFDKVHLDGLEPGASLCVDTVEVGQPSPGGALE